MPAAEIAAAVTGIRSALDIAKAMVGLRDAEAFRAKSIELQSIVLEALNKAIEARESYAAQADRVRALEAEVADLKAWGGEKEKYELKPNFGGGVAYMLKPDARGTEPPHWLCPQCYANGKKGFLLPADHTGGIHRTYTCSECKIGRYMYGKPKWDDMTQQSSQ
ncbi:MAG: hypothetical protein ABSA68_09550 [Xanthobacteraceae bacterium]|jgi:hypothetical protein